MRKGQELGEVWYHMLDRLVQNQCPGHRGKGDPRGCDLGTTRKYGWRANGGRYKL